MWRNLQFPADLVTFTEEILNGKLYLFFFFCVMGLKWEGIFSFENLSPKFLHFSVMNGNRVILSTINFLYEG